jgi:phosphate transport system protein
MDKSDLTQHISRQFNEELEDVRNKVLAMGGMVEQQLVDAVEALSTNNAELAELVITNDYRVNAMEVDIDEECTRIIARRQPTAGDLRLVMAIIKTVADLERIGDQAERIGRMTLRLSGAENSTTRVDLRHLGTQVRDLLHNSLDAFARMDAEASVAVARQDLEADKEYESILRQLITFMMEDPRTISRAISLIWSARALERVGDHARNICEYVVYLVKGKNVRHTSLEQMEKTAHGE